MSEEKSTEGEKFVKNLNSLAEKQIPPLMNHIRLPRYYQTLESMYGQAQTYLKEGDRERGYIFLQRYCMVYIDIIKKHKDYYSTSFSSQKSHHLKQCLNAMDYLERLKPLLIDKHDRRHQEEQEKLERERQEREKAAAAAAMAAKAQEEAALQKAQDIGEPEKPLYDYKPPSWDILRQPSAPTDPSSSSQDDNFSDITLNGKRKLVIPQNLVEDFLKHAMINTANDVETCGILTGKLENNRFYLSTVIIPPQSGTANTCVTHGEEKLIDIQMKYDLVTLGWIHTHPSQTCFLSSIDLHTQYSYQAMLPEAIAIVCAPQKSPDLGIFRITDPGMIEIQNCSARGFHEHKRADTYYHVDEASGDLMFDFNTRCQVIDLRYCG